MFSLKKLFEELLAKLREPGTLNPTVSDPVFYFVFPPEKMLEVKKALPRWSTKLAHAGFNVKRISLSDMLWRAVDDSGRWEEWLELEQHSDQEDINEAVRDVLRNEKIINFLIDEMTSVPENTIVLLTEAELLHPFFRTRLIESKLHDKVSSPIVIFYPGYRSGQHGLRFLGFHPVDGNYRSTILGGV